MAYFLPMVVFIGIGSQCREQLQSYKSDNNSKKK